MTEALYQNLITGTLNPAAQTVVITSVAPLRDLAPGSVQTMMAELQAWSGRCDSVLADLEAEIKKVKADAEKRAKREAQAEKQIKAVNETGEKGSGGSGSGPSRGGPNARGTVKREADDSEEEDDDQMDVDPPQGPNAGRKKSGGSGNILGRLRGRG